MKGYSLLETVIVSGVMLASLLLIFQMLGHATIWWRRQEDLGSRTAASRYVLHKITNLLYMAGYRPSAGGIQLMEPDRLAVEYLVEDADESPGRWTKHRLFTLYRDGSRLKLTVQRRLLPLEGDPSWGEGATSVLAEDVRELSFRYLDARGEETGIPERVRLVAFTLRLGEPGREGEGGDRCYRSSVFLRNHHG